MQLASYRALNVIYGSAVIKRIEFFRIYNNRIYIALIHRCLHVYIVGISIKRKRLSKNDSPHFNRALAEKFI